MNTDANTAALDRFEAHNEACEIEWERLAGMWPLEEFAGEAMANAQDPKHEMLLAIFENPNLYAALVRYVAHSLNIQDYYPPDYSDKGLYRDEVDLECLFSEWMDAEKRRLQAEKIRGEV